MHLGAATAEEQVVGVSVTQADDVAGNGTHRCGASVGEPLLKPGRRLAEGLQEEVVHARREVGAHLRQCASTNEAARD